MLTSEQFHDVQNEADDFCAQCAENGLADNDSCQECMIRRFLKFLKPKALFYHNGRKGWLPEGSLISFHYNDGTESGMNWTFAETIGQPGTRYYAAACPMNANGIDGWGETVLVEYTTLAE